jgi:hypothetical protein
MKDRETGLDLELELGLMNEALHYESSRYWSVGACLYLVFLLDYGIQRIELHQALVHEELRSPAYEDCTSSLGSEGLDLPVHNSYRFES